MPALVQPNLLRKLNERQVLETLQAHGPASRAEVSRISGISAPTVSKVVATLLDAGFLEELDALTEKFGRPAKLLRLATDSLRVIGIVIDVSQCSIVTGGLDGSIDWDNAFEISTPDNYDDLIDEISDKAIQLINRETAIQGIGLSVPGLIDQRQQKCLFSPNLHLTDGHSPGYDLSERLGLDTVMIHESQALCLAERLNGNAQGLNNFALLDVSAGLGMGVMTEGRLLEGHSGLAGELGHITIDVSGRLCGCGNRGCLETVATDASFVRSVGELTGSQCSFDEAVQLARSGNREVLNLLEQTSEYLAVAMAAVINILNPETLLIYSKLLDVHEDFFSSTIELTGKRALKKPFKDCRIIRVKGGKCDGAIAGVIHHLTKSLAPSLN